MENSSLSNTSNEAAVAGAGASTKSRRSSSRCSSTRRNSPLDLSEGQIGLDSTPVVPFFDTADSTPMVPLKPDLEATNFSCQNAFFFAKMSKIAYSSKEDVHEFMQGDKTNKGLGFGHFYWFEEASQGMFGNLFGYVGDTQAFIVANDDVIIVAFRGTSEATDWLTDCNIITRAVPPEWGFDMENCSLHQGFDDGVNTVWDGEEGMHQTIKKLYDEEGKSRKLFITGHSLGGALATIAAARLVFADHMNIAGMYTIGSPRVFAGALSAHFDDWDNHGTPLKSKYFRCRNNNDIVPRIMPPPYHHVGTEIYLDRFGAIGISNPLDRVLGRISAWLRMSFIVDVNDHSSSEYIRHFKQLVINTKVPLLVKAKSIVMDVTEKVTPFNADRAKEQAREIKEAKSKALGASMEAYYPTGLPVFDEEPTLMQGA